MKEALCASLSAIRIEEDLATNAELCGSDILCQESRTRGS